MYNDVLYIERDRENNTFFLKEDKKQMEKDNLLEDFNAATEKLKKVKYEKNKKELKRIRRRIIRLFKQFGEYELAVSLECEIEDEQTK